MAGCNRRNFSSAFHLETAHFDQHYTVAAAATAINVDKSPIASSMTPEQIEMRELKKRDQHIEI